MTHSDIVEFFNYNNITINSMVKIHLLTGKNFDARIACSTVLYGYDPKGFIINSHIKIIHPEDLIEYKMTQNPVDLFTDDIKEIQISDEKFN
jgi:hypothetical protein